MAHIQKDVKTKRGLNYHYLFVPSQAGKPTLVLLHGFPSTIRDWRFQIEHFSSKGYGLVVPDMLGYGGTDKPLDVKYYSWQDMSSDILDILDAEALDRVIVVGHDWSVASSRRSYRSRVIDPNPGVVPSCPVWSSSHPIASLGSCFLV